MQTSRKHDAMAEGASRARGGVEVDIKLDERPGRPIDLGLAIPTEELDALEAKGLEPKARKGLGG